MPDALGDRPLLRPQRGDALLQRRVAEEQLLHALADAADRLTQGGTDKVPHTADPDIALVGKAGIGLTAGQDLHLSSGDTTQIASGQDTHWAVSGQARVQTGQAIGILAGAIQPGSEAAYAWMETQMFIDEPEPPAKPELPPLFRDI